MKSLQREELTRLLRAARAHSKRDHLLILTAYSHGLRASEVVNLTDQNIRDGFLTVQRLKGSMRTCQPLVRSADPLYDESPLEKMTGRLFPVSRTTFWRIVQRAGRAAGLPQHLLHPHCLKHSIGMHTIKTAGIENVRQYLGHRSMASTGAYLRVDDDAASKAIAAAMGNQAFAVGEL